MSQQDIADRRQEKERTREGNQNWPDKGIRIEKARWGRSNIIKGKKKVELPKTVDASKITLAEAEEKLEKANSKTKKRKTKK
ncbi:MAG: hypothetical protein U5L96_14455 [Owenweeksia sp.]|nr:hypothetical protein [Owenweeksia sp.]